MHSHAPLRSHGTAVARHPDTVEDVGSNPTGITTSTSSDAGVVVRSLKSGGNHGRREASHRGKT